MGVHWGVSGSSSQVLTITVRNVLTCLRISEAFGKTEINDVDVVLLLADAYQEIIGLNISVEEVSRMHKLNSL